jgi:uncharacterized beta barrel domain-containing protein DUF5777
VKRLALAALLSSLFPLAAFAQGTTKDDDLEIDPSEPDFTVITLPTNLRLPEHKLQFSLTHRFSRPLGEGDFGDLVQDAFGFDSGAQIGLGLRFGLFSGTQLAFYRTSDRTIEFFAQSELVSQRRHPIGVSLHASVEGLDNFSENYSPSVSLVVSRKLGTRGAAYLVPRFVANSNLNTAVQQPGAVLDDRDSTFVLGIGLRVRVHGSAYLTGEYLPRLAGYKGSRGFGDTDPLVTFGVEGQVGGHVFALVFSNDLGTTPRQTVLGEASPLGWFIGFNLSRKFY